ncbi:glycosyltransferase [Mycobacterium sp. 1165178.9]|uniref:glycosyltransferase n=1 Tax=Mycobacterium sp. 1165178.9 TaxID=1834070 RepID=UPI0007FBBD62|nr:glycosyltransferase [Mycobacterium sp. 1165178.9]OBK88051.1 glycosyl transferase family 1 [Mycobacterium sp. 1165178.9]
MKFVLASYGSRGDVEPCAALGRELQDRGHEVCLVVAPDLVGFAESTGLPAVAYGPPTRPWQDVHRAFLRHLFRRTWKIRDLIKLVRQDWELFTKCRSDIHTTLTSLADGADLLLSGLLGEDIAANIAEHYDIPFVALHFAPARSNGQFLPMLPPALSRFVGELFDGVSWQMMKKLENAQRSELGLPRATGPATQRITASGALEVQAYDEICVPELAAEWSRWDGQRPFVGALTMELPTDFDGEVASWIAAGARPIYFGFGSIPVESSADTLAMISAACAELGERALVCAGWSDFGDVPDSGHVKLVDAVNHAAVLPVCRAVVHSGGAGTTAAGLRAGVPTLILATWPEQKFWGSRVQRLRVGLARDFSKTTVESLVADLRTVLAPQYCARAREVAQQMTPAAESASAAADRLEVLACARVG